MVKNLESITTTAMSQSTLLTLSLANLDKYVAKNPDKKPILNSALSTNIAASLRQIPFFARVPDNKMRHLIECFNYKAFDVDEVITQQGDAGDTFFFVLYGYVDVLIETFDDSGAIGEPSRRSEDLVSIDKRGAGNYFGEIALKLNMPRTATIKALQKSLLMHLNRADFQNLLKTMPDVNRMVDAEMRTRLTKQLLNFKIPFLHELADGVLSRAEMDFDVLELSPGENLMTQSKKQRYLNVIMYGKCARIIDGQETGELGIADYVGEVSMLLKCSSIHTITAKEYCVIMRIHREKFLQLYTSQPGLLSQIQLRILGEQAPLQLVLQHHVAYCLFEKFVKSELADEHLLFWKDVTEFEKMANGQQQNIAAERISELYLGKASEMQVNVVGTLRDSVSKIVSKGDITTNMFDNIKGEVVLLMERDNFYRFKKTADWENFKKSIGAYELDEKFVEKRRQSILSPDLTVSGLKQPDDTASPATAVQEEEPNATAAAAAAVQEEDPSAVAAPAAAVQEEEINRV